MIERLFNRHKTIPPRPWYAKGYIDFPTTVDEIAIVLRNGQIIRINGTHLTIQVEQNQGTFLNQIVFKINLTINGKFGIEAAK